MRDRRSTSSTITCSLSLWMLSLTGPISSVCTPQGARKRASEVPPPVNDSGRRPLTSRIAAPAGSTSSLAREDHDGAAAVVVVGALERGGREVGVAQVPGDGGELGHGRKPAVDGFVRLVRVGVERVLAADEQVAPVRTAAAHGDAIADAG